MLVQDRFLILRRIRMYCFLPGVHPNSFEQQSSRWTKNLVERRYQNPAERRQRGTTQTPTLSPKCISIKTYGNTNTAAVIQSIHTSCRALLLLVLFIACVNFTTLTLGTAGNAGARSRLAKSRWRWTHANRKPVLSANRSCSSSSHAYRWHCHRRTRTCQHSTT